MLVSGKALSHWMAIAALSGFVLAQPAAAQDYKEEYHGPDHGTPIGDPIDAEIDENYVEPKKKRRYRSENYGASRDYYDGSVKDDDYISPPRKRYSHKRHKRPYTQACVHPRDIRRGLRHDGWFGFADFEVDDEQICLSARRRDTGRRYDLILDRCSGLIVKAKPLRRSYRRWAEDRRWRRWRRDPYYYD